MRLYRNVAPRRGHWLQVRAYNPAWNRDALGATIRVRVGERVWVCFLHPSESYLCSSEPRAHFGLGETDHLDAIEIDWPDGSREIFNQSGRGYAVDQRLELRKGDSCRLAE